MISKFVATASADERERFHIQTQQLHVGLVTLVGEYRDGKIPRLLPIDVKLLPLQPISMVRALELLELSDELTCQQEVLADFATVYQEDFYRHSSVARVTSCFEAIESASFHQQAIADIRRFLTCWLSEDRDAAKGLASALIDAGASINELLSTHLFGLLTDKKIRRVMLESQVGMQFFADLERRTMDLRVRFPHTLWDGQVHGNNLDYVLSKEYARSQELFAPELDGSQKPRRENDTWLTVTEAAAVVGVAPPMITRAANEGKLGSNGKKGHDRRISGASLSQWQLNRALRPDIPESDAAIQRKLRRADT